MSIGISVQTRNTTMFVDLNGELDHHTSEEVRTKLTSVIAEHEIKNIIFNLKRLNFMDSSGIGIILGRYNQLKEVNGRIFVVGMNPLVSKVFKLSGLNKIIDVIENETEITKILEEVC